MDNLSKDMEKEINKLALKKPRPPKRNRRWTVMFVGDHGKIISFGRFKGAAVAVILLLTAVVAAAICFYLLYHVKTRENLRLQSELESSQQKLISLREEKDLLMVRLVLAESKKTSDSSQTIDKNIAKPSQKTEAAGTSNTPILVASSGPKTTALKTNTEANDDKERLISTTETTAVNASEKSSKDQKSQVVTAEDFVVQHDPSTNRLTVTFLLKKTEFDIETTSGRAFVTLQQDRNDPKRWLTMPSTPLVSGKPSQINRGQYFSIARFKPMKFERIIKADQSDYQYAVIHIFSTTGELLLEKGFPIKVLKRTAASGA
jgi:hypothetical protein